MSAQGAVPAPQAVKRCSKCGEVRGISDFGRRSSARDGRQSRCRACMAAYHRANRDRISRDQARRHLERAYGMTESRYRGVLAKQEGGCAICGNPCQSGRKLAVDHDHSCCPGPRSCGKCVRGLLCGNCNRGIGNLADSPERLEAAAAYLRAHRATSERGAAS